MSLYTSIYDRARYILITHTHIHILYIKHMMHTESNLLGELWEVVRWVLVGGSREDAGFRWIFKQGYIEQQ